MLRWRKLSKCVLYLLLSKCLYEYHAPISDFGFLSKKKLSLAPHLGGTLAPGDTFNSSVDVVTHEG